MELNTAASVITYLSKLEHESARLYEEWGSLYKNLRDSFAHFAAENRKSEKRVKQAYYGVVSDALETGFSFKGLRASVTIPEFRKEATASEILETAISLEKEIKDFYAKASSLSRSLLADVPRVMLKVAEARDQRIRQLDIMLESGGGEGN